MFKTHSTIIWDWNGTLLDDVAICIKGINYLLAERGLPILDEVHYKEVFCFPVRDYYEKIGFDYSKEAFEIPANQFIERYRALTPEVKLCKEALPTLSALKKNGYQQYILSAMEDSMLKKMTFEAGLEPYIGKTFGIANDFAAGKAHIGKQMISELNLSPDRCVMIGDSVHDAEVAKACGFDCILFSGGHFSKQRLEKLGLPIVNKLDDILTMI
jgi:Predicted phosphatases